MELARQTNFNLNISSETNVLSYTYTGSTTRVVMARVDLSDNIVGGGTYTLDIVLNGVTLSPSSSVVVESGLTDTIMVSRSFIIYENDVVVIKVTGLGGDTSVDTVAVLMDVTPITREEVTGDGSVIVDHDYGGTDELSYKTIGGVGVANATILVYLTSDYEADNRESEFLVARTTTVTGGKWAFSLRLDPDDYTLIYYKTGEYGPDREDITVS